MNMDIGQFHFIRPWLLLVMPVLFIIWLFGKELLKNNHWENVISKEMLTALQLDQSTASNRWRWLLLIAWAVAVISIAGPTWVKTSLPTLQNQKALVIALDLSPSMLAQDLNPDRLTRAKFKLIDILREQGDGQVALIAYAGDAHTVSPLTDDPRTIESLLTALHPSIMPSQGSNAEQAVALAQQLLSDAQASNGDILLITDGITADAQDAIKQQLKSALGPVSSAPNKLSILGVGGTQPAPIPQQKGGFLRGSNGEIILAGVNNAELSDLAESHSGQFASLSNDNSDIQRLLQDGFEAGENSEQEESQSVFYDSWEDMGHWLVLLILPFAAFCFRKGLIYILPIMFIVPIDSEAQSLNERSLDKPSWERLSWDNLWRTPDQQAQDLLNKQEYARAAEKFKRQDLAGAANYKANNYKQAIEQFSNSEGLDNLYNKGNAQAYSGDLQGALESYEKVLEQDADFADAAHNKKIIEELLKQQQEQQQNQDGDQNQDQEEQQQQDKQESNQQSDDSENSNSEKSDSEQADSQQQDNSEQEPSDSEEQQSDSEEQDESEEAEQEQAQQEPEQQESEEQQQAEAQAQAAEETDEPLKDTSEQWLRTIKDDPGRLLRNKFQYQAQQRQNELRRSNRPENNNTETRY